MDNKTINKRIRLRVTTWNFTIIQVYAPTPSADDKELLDYFYEQLQSEVEKEKNTTHKHDAADVGFQWKFQSNQKLIYWYFWLCQ